MKNERTISRHIFLSRLFPRASFQVLAIIRVRRAMDMCELKHNMLIYSSWRLYFAGHIAYPLAGCFVSHIFLFFRFSVVGRIYSHTSLDNGTK